jgi:hypothetical protein
MATSLDPVKGNMGMGIGAFYSQALQKDFSRDFQMRVVEIGPGGPGRGLLDERDNVYITTAVLPGYAIANQTVPYMGMSFNVPGGGNFPGSDGWSVTFRCDSQLNIREKLISWQKTIFNAFPEDSSNSVGAYGPKGTDTLAKMVVLNRDGTTARGLVLVGVYPVTVGEVAYDATANGNVVTLQATLAYQYWHTDNTLSINNPGGPI